MGYFKMHWSAELQEEVLKCVEEEVYLSTCLPFHKLIVFQGLVAATRKKLQLN
jgi:hypothetical protein